MVTRKRTDANHQEIVNALRRIGASVVDLSGVGDGCPDLLVGFRGKNYLMEVKDGAKKPSERRLRKTQVEFFQNWTGQAAKVEIIADALAVLGIKV